MGAITGILIGEMKMLNESQVVLALAGGLILTSAFLIKVIPDMTKHKMPNTVQDVLLVQFPQRYPEAIPRLNAQLPTPVDVDDLFPNATSVATLNTVT